MDEFLKYVKNVLLHFKQNLSLQQDGAPLHNDTIVGNYSNATYLGKCIEVHSKGAKELVRFPYLTQLDFFFFEIS